MDALCWHCEFVRYDDRQADPLCLARMERVRELPTTAHECAHYQERSWGTVFCPACIGQGAWVPLQVTDGSGDYTAVCPQHPAHRWPLTRPRGPLERCPACGAYRLTCQHASTQTDYHIVLALCPHCGAGQVRTAKPPRSVGARRRKQ